MRYDFVGNRERLQLTPKICILIDCNFAKVADKILQLERASCKSTSSCIHSIRNAKHTFYLYH